MTVHSILDIIDNFGDWAGDVYGTALAAQFSCAEVLTDQGEEVPAEWGYVRSPITVGLSADDDLLAWELYVRVTTDASLTWEHVRMAGAAMRGIVDHCKATGQDY